MKTSIVIVTYNNIEYTKQCIESIKNYTEKDTYEIIVVDNNSTDGTIDWLKSNNDIICIFNKENKGFPAACNQGINFSNNKDILLLNNDVIVTPNWLVTLNKCLYSSLDIGAVGAITNSCSYSQFIPVSYNSQEEMIAFARKNNISDSSKWEERLKLIGFCMLIKREVVDKIGLLDEEFYPGNYEDDDYCLRIRQKGYRLILCKDSFVHHFGSASFTKDVDKFNNILQKNLLKFESKWNASWCDLFDVRLDITEYIEKKEYESFSFLHIDCKGGGTLLYIKNKYRNSRLYGIEENKKLLINLDHFAYIKAPSADESNFDKELFDYIFIEASDIDKILSNIRLTKGFCKKDSVIILSIPIACCTIEYKLKEGLMDLLGNFHLDKLKRDNKIDFLIHLNVCNNEIEIINSYEKVNNEAYILSLVPETNNNYLTKNIGKIAFTMYKYFGYKSKVACFRKEQYENFNTQFNGLRIDFIEKITENSEIDTYAYLVENSKNISMLLLYELEPRIFKWVDIYTTMNPKGQCYLILNRNVYSINTKINLPLNSEEKELLEKFKVLLVDFKIHNDGNSKIDTCNSLEPYWINVCDEIIKLSKEHNNSIDNFIIEFICCTNNLDMFNRMVSFIKKLKIPYGFTLRVIAVKNAQSLASGYNTAMKASNAKYKVYLHQDVLIINENFIEDILTIFNKYTKVGLIGVVGAKTIPPNGVWWESNSNYGKVIDSHTGILKDLKFNEIENDYENVLCIDGLIMITQYDLPWREEIFKGWHFYDSSQSIEFIKAGYEVVVPNQISPWVVHDCGIFNGYHEYENNRNIFLKEYLNSFFPLVSVLIPAHNRPNYLKIALESALNQDYKNIEIIICDNSTNDDCKKLVESYLSSYNHIKYYKNEAELKVEENLKKCLSLSNGEYICYLMDDDIYSQNKVSKMVTYLINNNSISIVTSYRQLINEDGNILRPVPATQRLYKVATKVEGKFIKEYVVENNLNVIGEPTTPMFRRKLIEYNNFGLYKGKQYKVIADVATWFELLSKGDMIYLPDTLSYFRLHNGQDQQRIETMVEGVNEWFILANTCLQNQDISYDKYINSMKEILNTQQYLINFTNGNIEILGESFLNNHNYVINLMKRKESKEK